MFHAHDSERGEYTAGWAHLSFCLLYIFAFAFHVKGAVEHFQRAAKKQGAKDAG